MAMLQNVTSSAGLDHEWDKQTQHSYLQFDESLWSKLLEQLGFGILLFAKGSFLKDLQDEARLRFQKGAKVKVANDFEVQDPRSPAHWSAIIADCGRVFRPLDGDENIPGKEYVSMYFPPTPTGKSATRDVLVTDEVLMGSHRNCIAQQAYFDARPRDIPRGKAQILVEPGSVIVALWPTRIILYPLSQVRKPKHKKKFIPVEVQLPAGCMLFMTNIAHAGYGLWDLGEAFLHGCPSQDDLFAVPLNDFLVWYQARITRPMRSGQGIESLSDMIRLDKESECASYLDRDHMTTLTHIFPPVFLAKHLCQEKGATMIEDNRAQRANGRRCPHGGG